ncbi:hypothetical protein Vadar_012037 [Vaccinium darrowii]|uniref:Uncharacterized protein n=1 Tax=Vaccinium darrowii TaxID=229202 RepID=A0ACB7ZAQ5_9ERIC|nr:hypothetical protein Vadar_012037 [Vaccinium darrowii]
MSNLPDEVLVSIVSRLEVEQQARTSVLSRQWRYLWRFARILKLKFHASLWMDVDDELFGFICSKSIKSDIDGWVTFAFQKRVKVLRLKFNYNLANASWKYPLTADILHGHRLDSLTPFAMWHVDVTSEVLGHFVSVCPYLEDITVFHYVTPRQTRDGTKIDVPPGTIVAQGGFWRSQQKAHKHSK